MKRQVSDAKRKEISGHDIFAPPDELRPRNTDEGPTTPRGLHCTVSSPAYFFTCFAKDVFKSFCTFLAISVLFLLFLCPRGLLFHFEHKIIFINRTLLDQETLHIFFYPRVFKKSFFHEMCSYHFKEIIKYLEFCIVAYYIFLLPKFHLIYLFLLSQLVVPAASCSARTVIQTSRPQRKSQHANLLT